jgi:hypothetical protein
MTVSKDAKCSICKNKRQFLIDVYDRNDNSTHERHYSFVNINDDKVETTNMYRSKPICPMCFSMLNKTAMMYTEEHAKKEGAKA